MTTNTEKRYIECPSCKESIREDVRKCPHCHYTIDKDQHKALGSAGALIVPYFFVSLILYASFDAQLTRNFNINLADFLSFSMQIVFFCIIWLSLVYGTFKIVLKYTGDKKIYIDPKPNQKEKEGV